MERLGGFKDDDVEAGVVFSKSRKYTYVWVLGLESVLSEFGKPRRTGAVIPMRETHQVECSYRRIGDGRAPGILLDGQKLRGTVSAISSRQMSQNVRMSQNRGRGIDSFAANRMDVRDSVVEIDL